MAITIVVVHYGAVVPLERWLDGQQSVPTGFAEDLELQRSGIQTRFDKVLLKSGRDPDVIAIQEAFAAIREWINSFETGTRFGMDTSGRVAIRSRWSQTAR